MARDPLGELIVFGLTPNTTTVAPPSPRETSPSALRAALAALAPPVNTTNDT